ncbi:MAG: 2-amino-4-hydroxy-6-hydroxymethyldihydropteridine diphosphokinase [Granulosicoccaceae bacterium]
MARVFLSIGSNIRPEAHFRLCALALANHFSDLTWSPIYRSAAVGMAGDDFLNAVVSARTNKTVEATHKLLKQIEDEHGRVRAANKFTSRTLDIDLLLYDDAVLGTSSLTLPSPDLTSAAYVLVPLVDLEPAGVHPLLNRTYQELLYDLEKVQPNYKSTLSAVAIRMA